MHLILETALGRMLFKGEVGDNTREDRRAGLDHLKAASRAGNITARYLVGLAYRDGELTRQNLEAAKRLLRLAAAAGHAKAAYALAMMVHGWMGRWVPDTINLLEFAAGKGVREAAEQLDQVKNAEKR